MKYKIQTTHQPVDDKGKLEGDLLEVDGAEFIDLQRMGLIVAGAGDVDAKGRLKETVAKDAPVEVVTAFPTGPIPVSPHPAA